MPADNTDNVQYADVLANILFSLIGKAEKSVAGTAVISLEQLNSIYAGISRLSMVERHLHNITSGAYIENNKG